MLPDGFMLAVPRSLSQLSIGENGPGYRTAEAKVNMQKNTMASIPSSAARGNLVVPEAKEYTTYHYV